MPDQGAWERFFDPGNILTILGLDFQVADAAEFGCGYGTFTIPAAKRIKGKIYTFDIDREMIRITSVEARKQKLSNVVAEMRDFMEKGSGLKEESVDYVMLFNILHLENPETLLREAWRILRKNGKLGVIHWNYDSSTPRGPSMVIRSKPEDCIRWAESAGFGKGQKYDLMPYHYGIVMVKEEKGIGWDDKTG